MNDYETRALRMAAANAASAMRNLISQLPLHDPELLTVCEGCDAAQRLHERLLEGQRREGQTEGRK